MYRSTDSGRTFALVHGEGTDPYVSGFHFNCTDEGTSWSVLELPEASHDMPAGAYFFADRTVRTKCCCGLQLSFD